MGHFFLRPHLYPTGRITRVAGSHLSPYGEIASQWAFEGRESRVRGVELLDFADGTASYRLPCGRYELTSALG